MDNATKEYIRSLLPENLRDGRELLAEGIKIGKTVEPGTNSWLREKGVKHEVEYRFKRMAEGKVIWRALVGLATMEEQAAGIKELYEFGKRTGAMPDIIHHIPNMLLGLPKEYRENAPNCTSFLLEKPEDWVTVVEAAPFTACFLDYHLSSPNGVETIINAIKVGAHYSGIFAQFIWDYPGYTDEVAHMSEVVKALGIMATKRDDMFIVDSYLDDGIPAYCLDFSSFVGYALLEKYIVTDLCGARYAPGFGQLANNIKVKLGLKLALNDVLKCDDQPGLSHTYGNSINHWDHDVDANYGITCQELLAEILLERKYKTGCAIMPIPITEKVAVPTIEVIKNIRAVAHRLEEMAPMWDELIDFTPVEKIRDILKENGIKFFHNILDGFKESGIDIEDPLQMLLTLKRFSPVKLEAAFHPSVVEGSPVIKPVVPTAIAAQSLDEKDGILNELIAEGLDNSLRGKKAIVVSGDAHWYGAFVVDGVLTGLGAQVVNGGVGVSTVEVLDLADEEGINILCISVHNGQALDYGKQLLQLAKDRNKKYDIYMGGKLNAILSGHSEPSDVTGMLKDLGIKACGTLKETVYSLAK